MLYWARGSRHVIVLGPLTLKFPKIWLSRLWETILGRTFTLGWYWYWNSISTSFGENFREAVWFFRKKSHHIVPCVLPLILVNVYPTVRGVGRARVRDYLASTEWRANFSPEFRRAFSYRGCSHTFESDDNYALDRGEVKLLDYGAPGVGELLTGHSGEFEKFLGAVLEYTEHSTA